jgi:hypothetical protein
MYSTQSCKILWRGVVKMLTSQRYTILEAD